MPVVSNTSFVWPTLSAFINDLPDTAKSAIFGYVPDARLLNRLLVEAECKEAVMRSDFDRAARPLISDMERAPLGSWPHWSEWEALADKAGELRHASANAKLLANLWAGSMRLSSRLVTADQAVYRDPVADVHLPLGSGRVVLAPDRLPELIVTPRVPRDGATLLSADGTVHGEDALEGVNFVWDQVPGKCEVVDSRIDAPTRLWVVRDAARRLSLYNPADRGTAPLPAMLAGSDYAATSANNRYVAAAQDDRPWVFLHDRETGQTTELESPLSRYRWQLSVDSNGVVFVAIPGKGAQLAREEGPRSVDLDCQFGNYRLTPDERYLLVNDPTGTNVRLESREGGASKVLLQPGASTSVLSSLRILSLAFSPGLAWIATTCSDGTLSIYDLVGAEHEATLDPALHMRLEMQSTSHGLQNVAVWFDPDGSAVNVGYTERIPGSLAGSTVRLMRLPLVPDDRIAQQGK